MMTGTHDKKKPLILCDIVGTLVRYRENLEEQKGDNQKLIERLQKAERDGFTVRVCTGGRLMGVDEEILARLGFSDDIVNNVQVKPFYPTEKSGEVVAIIDDEHDGWIKGYVEEHENAEYFKPSEVAQLSQHLRGLSSSLAMDATPPR